MALLDDSCGAVAADRILLDLAEASSPKVRSSGDELLWPCSAYNLQTIPRLSRQLAEPLFLARLNFELVDFEFVFREHDQVL